MSNLKYTGIVKQVYKKNTERLYKRIINSIFKKKLKDKTELSKHSFMGMGGNKTSEISSNNVGVSFAVLKTDNGFFNSMTRRYAVLLTKDKKKLWNIPIFTMSDEKFNDLDEMLDAIYEKTLPIMKRLYGLDKIKYGKVHVIKISDSGRDIYVYVLPPDAWVGDVEAVRPPLDTRYFELDWFDQRSYSEDDEYWDGRYFGDKTAVIIQYINSFFDSRVFINSGSGIGY